MENKNTARPYVLLATRSSIKYMVPTSTWTTWNCVIYLSMSGKCLKFTVKSEKIWNLKLKQGKIPYICKFGFKIHFSRYHFQKPFIYIFVISTLSTQTVIQSQIDLGFH